MIKLNIHNLIYLLALVGGIFGNIWISDFLVNLTFGTFSMALVFGLGLIYLIYNNRVFIFNLTILVLIYSIISFINLNFDILTFIIVFVSQIFTFYILDLNRVSKNLIFKTNIIFLIILIVSFIIYLYQINQLTIFGLQFESIQLYREGRGINNYRGFTINPNVSLAPFFFIIILNLTLNKKDNFILMMLLLVSLISIFTESRVNLFISIILLFNYFSNLSFFKKIIFLVFPLISLNLFQVFFQGGAVIKMKPFIESIQFKLFGSEQIDRYRFEKWGNAIDEISWNFFGKGFDYYAFKYGFYAENSILELIIYFGIIPFLFLCLFTANYLLKNYKKINRLYISTILILLSLNMGNTYILIPVCGLYLSILKFKKI